MSRAAAREESSESKRRLYLAFDLGWTYWKLALTPGPGRKPRLRTVAAGSMVEVWREIKLARKRFGLPATTPVLSCYEAGRDGFWLQRCLAAHGVENLVIDAASIGRRRGRRRAKTDRLDATRLVTLLMRYHGGDHRVWRPVAVPSEQDEERRHLGRELLELKKERTRQINRMKGLMAVQGLRLEPAGSSFLKELESARLWSGQPVGEELQFRLYGEYERLQFLEGQIQEVREERQRQIEESEAKSVDQVRQLLTLRGIGIESAWLLTMELFAWRRYRNRKEAASLVGLTPTPFASGDTSRELGISKSGNSRVRTMLIEIAWGWVRYQPESQISRWYRDRFAEGGSRQRRIGIVAVARKLLIELWRFVELGVVPEGAVFKT